MRRSLGADARVEPQFGEQRDRPVLDDARAHATLHIRPVAAFEHHRLHPCGGEQVREQHPRRTRADDDDRHTPAPAVTVRAGAARSSDGPGGERGGAPGGERGGHIGKCPGCVSIVIQRRSVNSATPAMPPKRP